MISPSQLIFSECLFVVFIIKNHFAEHQKVLWRSPSSMCSLGRDSLKLLFQVLTAGCQLKMLRRKFKSKSAKTLLAFLLLLLNKCYSCLFSEGFGKNKYLYSLLWCVLKLKVSKNKMEDGWTGGSGIVLAANLETHLIHLGRRVMLSQLWSWNKNMVKSPFLSFFLSVK